MVEMIEANGFNQKDLQPGLLVGAMDVEEVFIYDAETWVARRSFHGLDADMGNLVDLESDELWGMRLSLVGLLEKPVAIDMNPPGSNTVFFPGDEKELTAVKLVIDNLENLLYEPTW